MIAELRDKVRDHSKSNTSLMYKLMFSWNISRALPWTVIVHPVAGISVWVHVWEKICQLSFNILVKYLLVQLKNNICYTTFMHLLSVDKYAVLAS